MSVNLFVGPLIDPDEENPKELDRLDGILKDLNAQLAALGLPPYNEPETLPEGYEFWNAIFTNQWMINLQAFLENLRQDPPEGIELRHLVNPADTGAHYFPVDFPDPLASSVEDDMVYGSCQALLREIEAVARLLGIPLERFPMDFSGDGTDTAPAWIAVYNELEAQGAPCTRLAWTGGSIEEQIHDFCEMTGTDEETFKISILAEHGSLEAYAESIRQDEPTDAENNMGLVFTLVNYHHGCKYAIQHNLTFGVG